MFTCWDSLLKGGGGVVVVADDNNDDDYYDNHNVNKHHARKEYGKNVLNPGPR
jgi:hypothetical protein